MFSVKLLRFAVILAGISVFLCSGYATARQTITIGTLGIGYDFWERTYDDEDSSLIVNRSQGDRREWGAWPEIELQSRGIHDFLSLRYAPVLRYDDISDSTDVDHFLVFLGERSLTREWNVSLSNNFVLSNDPARSGTPFGASRLDGGTVTAEGEAEQSTVAEQQSERQPGEITFNLGRNRYWTNDLILQTAYDYAPDSNAGLGYALSVLRNDSDDIIGYDEYDSHELFGLWSNRFNPSWRSQVDLRYIKGIYDGRLDTLPPGITPPVVPIGSSQDLQEYWADLRLDYDRSINDTFPLLYRFRGSQYDDFRQDIWVHQITLGWDHAFDSRTHLIVGAGPSYVNAEELDGEWGYNAYLSFTRAYQRGDITALINKRYDPRNFTGTGDTGMTDIADARVDLTYRLTRELSSTFFGLYRYENIINPQGAFFLASLGGRDPAAGGSVGDVTYVRDSYSAGASLDYTFLRWFVATVRYTYYQQDGDLVTDSYTDHRATFLITASKELWR